MAEIYYRRILSCGRGSFKVTIPLKYCKKYGIKSGDTVKVITTDIVTIEPIKEEEE